MRIAKFDELDQIYSMGFDVWSDGGSYQSYLEKCRASPKYQKGEWFVSEKDGALCASLLLHSFGAGAYGIGSIATYLHERKKGHASSLIAGVVDYLRDSRRAQVVYLYSDIEPSFYQKFGFEQLPSKLQNYLPSLGMVCVLSASEKPGEREPPPYF